ncbi:MAG: protein translocase subunit SecD [Thermodesulfovibrionales bacterium]|nr:protein translocase subunit SecD [Thermodesulfovibrionales bacterium]
MKKAVRWRLGLIGFTVVLSVIFFLPNTPLWKYMPQWWKDNMPQRGIVLGLDLQGGTHLVFEVDSKRFTEVMTDRLSQSLKGIFEKKNIKAEVFPRGNYVEIISQTDVGALIKENYPEMEITRTPTGFTARYSEGEMVRILENAREQALETIRNRIDQFGVAEPTIQKQGKDEVVVQLPGIKDPQRAIELIGKTAQLEFKLLDEETQLWNELPAVIKPSEEEDFLKQFLPRIPEGDEILFQRIVDRQTGEVYKKPYILKKEVLLTGSLLTDARVQIDSRFNEPYVSLTFNSLGARIFEDVTAKNVKKRLAIVLDGNVYSAPVIQERISGGNAQITGNFTMEEAKDLAIVLRAGALPAPLKLLENVTVGPSLGRDSIEAGKTAAIGAFIMVVIFMVFYYRLSGLIADIALILNLVLLIGAMAMLNATLTMPGIAGIILAIGMAVDSNVLMFERIREELRHGKTPRAAIDSGYKKAFWTIFDSHVTTLITAAVLFQFGTGPIKGFAVTLSLGVAINLFTALIGTKTVFDMIISRKTELRRLSI